MPGIIIGLIIAAYSGYLIYKRVKNIKAGNYCGNCAGCPSAKACGQYKDSNYNGRYYG